jgi:hypothetical protein
MMRALGRNPLVRASDRCEALAVLVVIVVGLLAIPFAARFEASSYDDGIRIVEQQTSTRHTVETAVVRGSVPTDFDSPLSVLVQWHDGPRLRTEEVVSPATVKPGATLNIWLDDTGKVTSAPLTPVDVKITAVSVGWTVWALAVVFSGIVAVAFRVWLDRSRARAWERALLLMAHNDDGWANRRS